MSTNDSALEVMRLLSEVEDYTEIGCPDCHGRLVVHQPDERQPERLLATCRACFAWFLMDAPGRILLRLPGEAALRKAAIVCSAETAGRFVEGPCRPHRVDRPQDLPKDRRGGRRGAARMESSPP